MNQLLSQRFVAFIPFPHPLQLDQVNQAHPGRTERLTPLINMYVRRLKESVFFIWKTLWTPVFWSERALPSPLEGPGAQVVQAGPRYQDRNSITKMNLIILALNSAAIIQPVKVQLVQGGCGNTTLTCHHLELMLLISATSLQMYVMWFWAGSFCSENRCPLCQHTVDENYNKTGIKRQRCGLENKHRDLTAAIRLRWAEGNCTVSQEFLWVPHLEPSPFTFKYSNDSLSFTKYRLQSVIFRTITTYIQHVSVYRDGELTGVYHKTWNGAKTHTKKIQDWWVFTARAWQ